ncbi:ATP-binding protein [Pseudomonas sp. KBS0710]|uniref:AlbA family DNA-binding domain-containing protein n=1 Tax=Pseudomonas sp. KBS0710 TaxID=1179667 RepID=UPI00110D32F8|nr:ATP-binding protein [Pseudomonas sp. KBS0710]TSD76151.1 ATP-binding protein [Pseudomonas sp. KBS0710]
MDDEALIDTLLYKGEGTTLDYKVQQYPHDGATPDQKGELLKDVLAFVNAWRSEPAYILIGVSNTLDVVGLDRDLDDSRLQQFINGKTNVPVQFSYRLVKYKGLTLGLYTIPVQDRPVYAKQQYGKVLPNIVYVRRGSATDIASPTEIAKMGEAKVESTQSYAPVLELETVNANGEPATLDFEYQNVLIDQELPDYIEYKASTPYSRFTLPSMTRINEDYYREKAAFIQQRAGLLSIKFLLRNTGSSFANDVSINVEIPLSENFQVVTDHNLLPKPEKKINLLAAPKRESIYNLASSKASLDKVGNKATVVFRLGKIQSGEAVTTDRIYLIRPPQSLTKLDVKILSDQLRAPMSLEVPIQIQATEVELTYSLLKRLIEDE